ncbi:hypothetical protein VTH06DRAFT_4436 [Thermothelomyces fergusii]
MAMVLAGLLCLGAAVSPAWAGSISAWHTSLGPQVILVNDTTNEIRYTACNSDGVPAYSYTEDYALTLDIPPKVGTPVAGVGWYDNTMTYASIWYIDKTNNITNGFFTCNMTSGRFLLQGNWTITSGAPSIHSNSGLSAIVLGEDTGYRVYFHDEDGAINELYYTLDSGWEHRGPISQDINSLPAVGAGFSGRGNITVASPRDERNIAVTRFNRDETWFRTTLPHPLALEGGFATTDTARDDFYIDEGTPTAFTLPAWDGQTKSIGVTIDKSYTRFLWYIGNDRNLHLVANQDYTWGRRASEPETVWPKADDPNAYLGVTYEMFTNRVWLYYFVEGRLGQVKYADDAWHAWSALEEPAPPPTQTPSPPSDDDDDDDDDDDSTDLSTGAKAGIGVGVSLGAIAFATIIAIVFLTRRKKKQARVDFAETEAGSTTLAPDTPATPDGSPAVAHALGAQKGGYVDQKIAPLLAQELPSEQQVQQLDGATRLEMDSSSVRAELDPTTRAQLYAQPQPIYELPSHSSFPQHPAGQPGEWQRQ